MASNLEEVLGLMHTDNAQETRVPVRGKTESGSVSAFGPVNVSVFDEYNQRLTEEDKWVDVVIRVPPNTHLDRLHIMKNDDSLMGYSFRADQAYTEQSTKSVPMQPYQFKKMSPALQALVLLRMTVVKHPVTQDVVGLPYGIDRLVLVFGPTALEQAASVLIRPSSKTKWGAMGYTGTLRRTRPHASSDLPDYFDTVYMDTLPASPIVIIDALELAKPDCMNCSDIFEVAVNCFRTRQHEKEPVPKWFLSRGLSLPAALDDIRTYAFGRPKNVVMLNPPLGYADLSDKTKGLLMCCTIEDEDRKRCGITVLKRSDLRDKGTTGNLHESAVERLLGQRDVESLFNTLYCECSQCTGEHAHPLGACFADISDFETLSELELFQQCGHRICHPCLLRNSRNEKTLFMCTVDGCSEEYDTRTAKPVKLPVYQEQASAPAPKKPKVTKKRPRVVSRKLPDKPKKKRESKKQPARKRRKKTGKKAHKKPPTSSAPLNPPPAALGEPLPVLLPSNTRGVSQYGIAGVKVALAPEEDFLKETALKPGDAGYRERAAEFNFDDDILQGIPDDPSDPFYFLLNK